MADKNILIISVNVLNTGCIKRKILDKTEKKVQSLLVQTLSPTIQACLPFLIEGRSKMM